MQGRDAMFFQGIYITMHRRVWKYIKQNSNSG